MEVRTCARKVEAPRMPGQDGGGGAVGVARVELRRERNAAELRRRLETKRRITRGHLQRQAAS